MFVGKVVSERVWTLARFSSGKFIQGDVTKPKRGMGDGNGGGELGSPLRKAGEKLAGMAELHKILYRLRITTSIKSQTIK
ncbi:MAG: hypothetical protein LBO66_08640 [Deltaproteobacteria bacterium]|jgi:hypothetical protein|nr:hypothetical protein [Deltaproteobacteria bacterium]